MVVREYYMERKNIYNQNKIINSMMGIAFVAE